MKHDALELLCRSEEETIAVGARLGRLLRSGDLVALHGELGAGKTRLVRGIAEGLGLDPGQVNSPTYVLVNVYEPSLVHVDAYRMHGPDELASLGWDRLLDGSRIVVIEWAERLAGALPADRVDITMEHVDEHSRLVRLLDRTSRGVDFATLRPRPKASTPARCRTCGGSLPPGAPLAPFCCERCRMADLGRWFSGHYKISRPIDQKDLDAE